MWTHNCDPACKQPKQLLNSNPNVFMVKENQIYLGKGSH